VQAAGPVEIVDVTVDCMGDDGIGQSLCYAVKEKIRSSRGFELVSDIPPPPRGFTNIKRLAPFLGLHLVSADDTLPGLPQGAVSVVALTVTLNLPSGTNAYW
jgi:hypothetical protein